MYTNKKSQHTANFHQKHTSKINQYHCKKSKHQEKRSKKTKIHRKYINDTFKKLTKIIDFLEMI